MPTQFHHNLRVLYCQFSGWFVTLSILLYAECYVESDIAYFGNDLNNGLDNKQSDGEACRVSCGSISGAEFFDWVSTDYQSPEHHSTCWCKSSDSGRGYAFGVTAGNVICVHATNTTGKAEEFL